MSFSNCSSASLMFTAPVVVNLPPLSNSPEMVLVELLMVMEATSPLFTSARNSVYEIFSPVVGAKNWLPNARTTMADTMAQIAHFGMGGLPSWVCLSWRRPLNGLRGGWLRGGGGGGGISLMTSCYGWLVAVLSRHRRFQSPW